MKTLLFLCGLNGVGKTAAGLELYRRFERYAYVDSECCRMVHPFSFTPETIALVRGNLSVLLRGYLTCPAVDTVVFPYGFHGPRREISEGVRADLADLPHRFVPFLLTCSREENVRRMQSDGRDPE